MNMRRLNCILVVACLIGTPSTFARDKDTYFFLTAGDLAGACGSYERKPKTFPYRHCQTDLLALVTAVDRLDPSRGRCQNTADAIQVDYEPDLTPYLVEEFLRWSSANARHLDSAPEELIYRLNDAGFGCSVILSADAPSEPDLRIRLAEIIDNNVVVEPVAFRNILVKIVLERWNEAYPSLSGASIQMGSEMLANKIDTALEGFNEILTSRIMKQLGRDKVMSLARGDESFEDMIKSLDDATNQVLNFYAARWLKNFVPEVERELQKQGHFSEVDR